MQDVGAAAAITRAAVDPVVEGAGALPVEGPPDSADGFDPAKGADPAEGCGRPVVVTTVPVDDGSLVPGDPIVPGIESVLGEVTSGVDAGGGAATAATGVAAVHPPSRTAAAATIQLRRHLLIAFPRGSIAASRSPVPIDWFARCTRPAPLKDQRGQR